MTPPVHQPLPPSNRLHPGVYLAMAALAVWLVVSVWGFAGDGYADWLLVVVSAFILAVVALMLVLSKVGTRDPGARSGRTADSEKFHDWAEGEFDTWQDHVKGRNAAIEILLPIAAVAFGMSAFAVAFWVAQAS